LIRTKTRKGFLIEELVSKKLFHRYIEEGLVESAATVVLDDDLFKPVEYRA